jgi:hypothetical protein
MTLTLQDLIVLPIVLAALAYLVWCVRKTLGQRKTAGCTSCSGCASAPVEPKQVVSIAPMNGNARRPSSIAGQ